MSIHFANMTAAIDHFRKNDWRKLRSGNWLSPDKSCAAHILTRHDEVVLVQYWLI